jgi:replicative DNA helicase
MNSEPNLPKSCSDYILDAPFIEASQETYIRANEEILLPFEATRLPDFQKLDKLTGGLRPREFSIICGATGVGKTTLVANISKSLITQRIPHFVASVETGRTDFMKRVMSAFAREDWNTGEAIPIEKVKAFHAIHGHFFRGESLFLSRYENRFSVETLMSDIAWMVEHHSCKVAIVDNLNFFLEVRKGTDQLVEMDRVVHSLVIFCKQVDVHVIMIMHPKKTDHGRVESEFDIKGSSTAVQEAHNVFLFNRPSESIVQNGLASPFDRELKIAKMRRKGRAVGARLILKNINGVLYEEGDLL